MNFAGSVCGGAGGRRRAAVGEGRQSEVAAEALGPGGGQQWEALRLEACFGGSGWKSTALVRLLRLHCPLKGPSRSPQPLHKIRVLVKYVKPSSEITGKDGFALP